MYKQNKGISPVVAVALLLIVSVVSVVSFQIWYTKYGTGIFSKIEGNLDSNSVKIEYLEPNKVYLLNLNNQNLTIENIKIDGTNCNVNGTLGSLGVYQFNLGTCLQGMSVGPKEIVVYTKEGIFSETKMLRTTLSSSGNLTFSFDIGNACLTGGYTKIYAFETSSDSHVENATSNLYSGLSACIGHLTYTIGNTCSGNYQRLFYIDNSTNAHAYTDNTTSYVPYDTWQEICVSSSGGVITIQVGASGPVDSVCIGNLEDPIDNVNGMHMSNNCASGNSRIWLKIV